MTTNAFHLKKAAKLSNKGGPPLLTISNPTQGLDFLPVEKRRKYVPSRHDIVLVIAQADRDTQEYLWTVSHTMARISEVNSLTWNDVDFAARTITLYTRKKRGGHLTPRVVPMTNRLLEIMSQRSQRRDENKPWVFWHRYWSHREGGWVEGPFHSRHHLLRDLCSRAGVRPFGFHALRHAGASLLDQQGVPLGTIQRILGHENRTTTEIYLHSIGENEREAMVVFERTCGDDPVVAGSESHSKSHSNRRIGVGLKIVKG